MLMTRKLLLIDLVHRLADLHWREWGSLLGIDMRGLTVSSYGSPGSELIRQWASANGIPEAEAPLEMARRLGLKLSLKQRLLLSEKANHMRLGAVSSPRECDISSSPLESLGFQLGAFYPYATPDGKSVSGGVGYLNDAKGNTIRLPATPWNDESHRVRWDWLSWDTPLPLYRSHEIFTHPERSVFIFPS